MLTPRRLAEYGITRATIRTLRARDVYLLPAGGPVDTAVAQLLHGDPANRYWLG